MTNKWILPSSLTIAMGVSCVLFAFMASLVQKPKNQPAIKQVPGIEILTNLNKLDDEQTKPPAKTLPPKPNKAPPPNRQTVDIQQTTDVANKTPSYKSNMSIGEGIAVGSGQHTIAKPTFGSGNDNSAARAIVQIPPQYPIDAAQKGIEGWVKLSFSIDTDGTVTDIQVVDAHPKRIFNRAAKKALKGWRYQAKFVDAVPVMQHNMMIQLDFEMEK